MKKFAFSTVLLLIFTFQVSAQAQKVSMNSFRFLVGNWSMDKADGKIIEVWKQLSQTSFSGKSYSINAVGDSTLLETIELKTDGSNIVYVPLTAGQIGGKPVVFTLTASRKRFFMFENRLHDFPYRIVYHLKSDGRLLAWIEGFKDGRKVKIKFPYKKIRS